MGVSKAKISELRHRITIEQLSLASDGQGGSTESWSTFATVWAKVKPVSSSERLFTQQIQYQRTHEITVRWLDNLNTNMRIDFKGRKFQIKGFRYPDERKFWILIDAEENQGT